MGSVRCHHLSCCQISYKQTNRQADTQTIKQTDGRRWLHTPGFLPDKNEKKTRQLKNIIKLFFVCLVSDIQLAKCPKFSFGSARILYFSWQLYTSVAARMLDKRIRKSDCRKPRCDDGTCDWVCLRRLCRCWFPTFERGLWVVFLAFGWERFARLTV